MNKSIRNIHFMGIGGSGISGVACLAKHQGFNVDGCDLTNQTAYSQKLKKYNIQVENGHSQNHLKNADLVVITPAVIYQNSENKEYLQAVKEGKVLLWNKFVGDYLLSGKNVIAVAGTHGKGTVTAMTALLFEKAQLDPSVLIGATVKEWNSNYRVGKSDIFVIEADEFYEKFLDYKPSSIIINNIEFDHPDYFRNENQMITSFVKFVKGLKKGSNLIINLDSEGILKMLSLTFPNLKNGVNIYGYTLKPNVKFDLGVLITGIVTNLSRNETKFRVYSKNLGLDDIFSLNIPGEYNVSNALGLIIVGKLYNIETKTIRLSLSEFTGIVRRMDKVLDKKDIVIYDDYAHHPTAIQKTLEAIRQKHPFSRIIVINEPHSYSRTKALLSLYEGVFKPADKVYIGPIFRARDKKTYGINGVSIVKASKHKDIKFIPTFKQIFYKLKKEIKKGDVIVVMGAGDSYKWSKEIISLIK